MSNPFFADDMAVALQMYTVREALCTALSRLWREYNKEEGDAEKLITANLGRGARPAWYDLAWEVTSARAQLIELEQRQKNEERERQRAKDVALLATCTLRPGDRVRRSDGSTGIVQHIYIRRGNSSRRDAVQVAVDWPAPHRIGGDGWHRSDVLATSLRIVPS